MGGQSPAARVSAWHATLACLVCLATLFVLCGSAFADEPWLGLDGNSGGVAYESLHQFTDHNVVYDRGGAHGSHYGVDFKAGELPSPSDSLAKSVYAGMIPVVTIEYDEYSGWGSDPNFPHTSEQIASYVAGFEKTASAIREAYPSKKIVFEVMNEAWGNTTPTYDGAEYAAVVAALLPKLEAAGIPLSDIYVDAFGADMDSAEEWTEGWIPAMYEARPSLESEVQGWSFQPYGPAKGTSFNDSEGIESVPVVREQIGSGRNNIIVSGIGYCAADVEAGAACREYPAESGLQAAGWLTETLETALGYHEAGWLKALLVYARHEGGWSMQLNGEGEGEGVLTSSGEALEAFADAHSPPTPTVADVSANNGPATGGTTVTITGAGFATGSSVKFGALPATSVTVNSWTSISATSPAGAGMVDITVTNANGTSATDPGDQFAYDPAPTGAWLGLDGNSDGVSSERLTRFMAHNVVFDRGGPHVGNYGVDFEAGELPNSGDDLEAALDAGMTPVVTIEYDGYLAHGWGSDTNFPHTPEQIANYVSGFVETAVAIRAAHPGKTILFEAMNEAWGNTTPTYDGAQYADVIAALLPKARTAGIPLEEVYVDGFGADMNSAEEWTEGWIPAMYQADPVLESEIQGWSFQPFGPDKGALFNDSDGIESLPAVRELMLSGENNVIVSGIGYCALDVEEGAGCWNEPIETSAQAAEQLEAVLNVAEEYRQQGWLRALLVYRRREGGWAMELEGGALTKQGEKLEGLSDGYTPNPEINSVSPNHGPAAGGTTVTITGKEFLIGSTVKFGSAAAGGVTVDSPDSLTATSPAGSGSVDVTIEGAAGGSSTTSSDRFQYTTPPHNTSAPSIEGSSREGQTLTAEPGSWTGEPMPAFAYRWEDCSNSGGECEPLENATAATLQLGSGDVGGTIRVTVTATNLGGGESVSSATTAEVESGAPSELQAPTIDGSPNVGQSLSASPGLWGGTAVELRYQWERCDSEGAGCEDVAGATEDEYRLGEADLAHTFRVRVGASNELASATALSPATTMAGGASLTLTGNSEPTLSGTEQSEQVLTVSPGAWTGVEPIVFAYTWERCDAWGSECEPRSGQHGSSYALEEGDAGHVVRVVVTSIDANGSQTKAVDSDGPVAAYPGPIASEAPRIGGVAIAGQILHAGRGDWTGAGTISYAYQWVRCREDGESCTPIEDATSSTYTSTEGDVGSALRIAVTATDEAGSSLDVSPPTPTVATASPAHDSTPSISGAADVGEPLEADPGIWSGDGAMSFSYQWQRCGETGESCSDISDANESQYVPGEADAEHTLRIRVTASDPAGSENETSGFTSVVNTSPTIPMNVTPPEVSGNATVGDTLSVEPGDWYGSEPLFYSYQWQRCNEEAEECSSISGATSASYVLAEGDVGSTVDVIVTATNSAGSESAESDASEAIGAVGAPEATEEGPAIIGEPRVGETLYVANGRWSGSRPLSFAYSWELCDAAGGACTAIEGAGSPSYTPVSGNAGQTLRIVVTAANDLGRAAASSPAEPVAAAGEASTTPAIELAEETDPSVLQASTSATLEEQEVKPSTSDPGEELVTASALASSSISKETPGEFAVNTPDGELSLTPLGSAAGATRLPTIVNDTAAVYANAFTATDLIVRPEALGASTILQLRSAEAPTSFSWELGLGADQYLESQPDGSVAVVESTPETYLEEPPGEPFESSGESAESSEAEGVDGNAAEEALGSSLEGESPLEKLSAAPHASTPEVSPKAGELHPQETVEQYERGTDAVEAAEAQTGGRTLMVIEAPTVLDATGKALPATLNVAGDTLTLTISAGEGTAYPVTAQTSVATLSDLASAAKGHTVRYGLSDPKAQSFTTTDEDGKAVPGFDPHLKSGPMHVGTARLVLNYNTPPKNPKLREWLQAVGKDGLQPYITLRECKKQEGFPACPPGPPSFATYRKKATELMKVLMRGDPADGIPAVSIWGAWNEPDDEHEPLGKSPGKAADFWQILQAEAKRLGCRCTVVAGEFLQYDHYIAEYIKAIVKKRQFWYGEPHVWGLHDYYDLTHLQSIGYNSDANKFLNLTRKRLQHPHVWLSEMGAELQSSEGWTPLVGHPKWQSQASEDFLHIGPDHPRIDREYYYLYTGPTKISTERAKKERKHVFDSALLPGEGITKEDGYTAEDPRPAYCVLALGKKGCRAKVATLNPVSGNTGPTVGQALLSVDPGGLPSTFWVEYGTTTAYGRVSSSATTLDEEGARTESLVLTGLSPCTTYHYQAEAENEANEGSPSLGGDQAFTTAGCGSTNAATDYSGGWFHSCAVVAGGHVECWGENSSGELGDGTRENSSAPVRVSGVGNAIEVAAGSQSSCALLSTDTIDCWGEGNEGELGDGTTEETLTPEQVSGITEATAVSAGENFACAVMSSGSVKCWEKTLRESSVTALPPAATCR